MDANAGREPTQELEGPSTHTTGGTKPLHRFLRGEPKAVGIVLLFLGLCMFMFGIPVKGVSESSNVYSPFWLGILYFICGILYIQAERNTTKKIVTASLAFSIIAILGTIVGAITFIKSVTFYPHHYYMYSESESEAAIEHTMQVYSIEAVFLFHSLVAGVILIAMSVFARLALRSTHTQMFVVMRYPPSAE